MSSFVRESVTVNGKPLVFETGRLAKQAHGAVLVTYGESVVLVTAVAGDERPGIDFFPLTCDYVEKTFAAGKIPGGFFKREGCSATRRSSPRASSIARAVRSSPTGSATTRRSSPPSSRATRSTRPTSSR